MCHLDTPDVPFCSVGRAAMEGVLARRSAHERVRPAAPTSPPAERSSACCSGGAGGLPCLLLSLRPYRQEWGMVPLQRLTGRGR
jgi:hypothetical protein